MNLRSERVRGWAWQAALLAAVACVAAWLVGNTLDNLATRGIQVGFGFLGQEAGFAISQTPVPYRPGDTYARALGVGIANTLLVSAIGIVVATVLGTAIGVARLASNRLLSGLAGAYVEAVRNVPLLRSPRRSLPAVPRTIPVSCCRTPTRHSRTGSTG